MIVAAATTGNTSSPRRATGPIRGLAAVPDLGNRVDVQSRDQRRYSPNVAASSQGAERGALMGGFAWSSAEARKPMPGEQDRHRGNRTSGDEP